VHLSDLLARANEAGARALEIIAERPVTLETPEGPVELGGIVAESELLGLFESTLTAEQQIELAIGNPVMLSVDTTRGVWTLLAEAYGDRPGLSGRVSLGTRTLKLRALDDDSAREASGGGALPPPPSSWGRQQDEADERGESEHAQSAPVDPPPLRIPSSRPSMGALPSGPVAVTAVAIDEVDLGLHVIPGSVVLSLAPDEGEYFASRLGAGFRVVIDEDVDARGVVNFASEIAEGDCLIVRCEDPSRPFAWLMRRVEEGARVIVETRCTTVVGARRMFIGLLGAPAERWLDAVPNFVFANGRLTQL
jgi:hypothetical protein